MNDKHIFDNNQVYYFAEMNLANLYMGRHENRIRSTILPSILKLTTSKNKFHADDFATLL